MTIFVIKKIKFLAIFWQSNGNFPEGQPHTHHSLLFCIRPLENYSPNATTSFPSRWLLVERVCTTTRSPSSTWRRTTWMTSTTWPAWCPSCWTWSVTWVTFAWRERSVSRCRQRYNKAEVKCQSEWDNTSCQQTNAWAEDTNNLTLWTIAIWMEKIAKNLPFFSQKIAKKVNFCLFFLNGKFLLIFF